MQISTGEWNRIIAPDKHTLTFVSCTLGGRRKCSYLPSIIALTKTLTSSPTRLAKQPDIAVSVDLLVVLLADEDAAVRKAALEVYLRRVYRAHCIKTLLIQEADGIISAEWAFTTR